MKLTLINCDQLALVLDKDQTNKRGEEIYERTTNGFAFEIDGIRCTIDRHGYTNLGSVPQPIQIIPFLEHWRFPCSYATHDSIYSLHGMWVNGSFINISRHRADNILKNMVMAEGIYCNNPAASKMVAPVIYFGVRMGGWYNWYCQKNIDEAVKSDIK